MTCGSGTAIFPTAEQAKQLSRNYEVIWAEISAIQSAILKATSGCYCVNGEPVNRGGKFCVIVDDNTPMTYNRGLASIEVVTPGANYFPIVSTVAFSHPTGTGATGTVTVSPSGVIVAIPITAGGTGYETIYATADLSAGLNGNITLITNSVTGAITSTTIVNPGVNYVANDPIPVVGTNGTGANLFIGSVGINGEILSVIIANGGSGYQPITAQAIITHPIGQGFDGLVLVNSSGAITGVSIQNGGILYGTLMPNIFIDDVTGNGSGASAYATVDDTTGSITDIIIANKGANYSTDTVATVIPALTSLGADATLHVTTSINPYGTDPYLYYLSLIGQLESCAIKDQIEQVKNYFTQLGYMIEAQVNPNTDGTIQWEICWC